MGTKDNSSTKRIIPWLRSGQCDIPSHELPNSEHISTNQLVETKTTDFWPTSHSRDEKCKKYIRKSNKEFSKPTVLDTLINEEYDDSFRESKPYALWMATAVNAESTALNDSYWSSLQCDMFKNLATGPVLNPHLPLQPRVTYWDYLMALYPKRDSIHISHNLLPCPYDTYNSIITSIEENSKLPVNEWYPGESKQGINGTIPK
ncbi:unnamed protein product [Thelazia callipaeda]|uniref:Uncharacterized protein n=1 Tax=Thelazia callipaeda TaxID=103827 RepID=A0A0N5CR82_THECL|nr:unnamed protein product [Thelazia callipaeda]